MMSAGGGDSVPRHDALRGYRGGRTAGALLVLVLILTGTLYRRVRADGQTTAPAPGWTLLPLAAPPPPRSQFGMAADTAGNIYVYGGSSNDGGALADFWVLHPGSHAWVPIANTVVPALIEPHLAVDADGDVFEFGGIGNPTGHHFSYDGHSFGLYEYQPAQEAWIDLTPAHVEPGLSWPGGREDFGFAFDPDRDQLVVFAGEGNGDTPLNDMWTYDLGTSSWQKVAQRYSAPYDAIVDPREIYNISYDNHGGFFLFGGSYLAAPAPTPPLYVNDLWRFDVGSATWTLLAGYANGYDQNQPLPRHYYGQACDAAGNFYMLDGYLSDTADHAFFQNAPYAADARPVTLAGLTVQNIHQYALADFWRYDAATHQWIDLSRQMGDLTARPAIPYVMIDDTAADRLVTFGGFYPDGTTLQRGNATWVYGLAPTGTPATGPTAPSATPSPTASATPTASPAPSTTPASMAATSTPVAPMSSGDGSSGDAGAGPGTPSSPTPTPLVQPPPDLLPGDDANPPHP